MSAGPFNFFLLTQMSTPCYISVTRAPSQEVRGGKLGRQLESISKTGEGLRPGRVRFLAKTEQARF